MPSSIKQSVAKAYIGSSTAVASGAASGYQITLPGVVAGNTLRVSIAVYRAATAGELMNTPADNKSNGWAAIAGAKVLATVDGTARLGIYEFIAHNVAAGDTTITLDCVNETSDNRIHWCAWEMPGIVLASAVDKAATATAANADASISVATGALAQDGEMITASVAGRWWFSLNGGAAFTSPAAPAGNPPTGFTVLAGMTSNSDPGLPSQFAYRRVSTKDSVTAAWTVPANQGSGGVASIVAHKEITTRFRVRIEFDANVAGKTGVTAYAWNGDPTTVLAKRWTGRAAEANATAGKGYLLLPLDEALPTPPTGWAAGLQLMTKAFLADGSEGGLGATIGTVEEF